MAAVHRDNITPWCLHARALMHIKQAVSEAAGGAGGHTVHRLTGTRLVLDYS